MKSATKGNTYPESQANINRDANPEAILKMKLVDKLNAIYEFERMFKKHTPDINALIRRISVERNKKSFLVFSQNRYITVPTQNIAFFFVKNGVSTIQCYNM